jgi:hypothetical protein
VTRIVVRVLFAFISFVAMAGCTTVNVMPQVGMASTEFRSSTYVGIVTLRLPATLGNVQAVDVKTLGAGWQSGPFVGWNASNLVTANPADCQLLIIIRSPAQAENAAKVISSLEGQNPCIVDFTQK